VEATLLPASELAAKNNDRQWTPARGHCRRT